MHPDFTKIEYERKYHLDWSMKLFHMAKTSTKVISSFSSITSYNQHNDKLTKESVIKSSFIMRPLLENEIITLETICRCRSKDWSKIRLVLVDDDGDNDEDDMSSQLKVLVSDTYFEDTVVLMIYPSGSSTNTDENETTYSRVPIGIHNCTVVANCVITLNRTRIHRCSVIEDTVVDQNTVILQCGTIQCQKKLQKNQFSVSVGPESGGGRNLNLIPEATMIDVGKQLLDGISAKSNTTDTANTFLFNYIGKNSIIRDTPEIDTIFLHTKTSIIAATSVTQCILFPNSLITNASIVHNTILQWDCKIIDNSSITDALLMECACIGPSSVVASSILGPDVHVSCGEVHASILGPNTNAHHQSLIISVIWPLGRGNVGYGANVGSNHTGRIPDQETCAGEGTFWGLSTVIKFPVDLSSAPYTIVAAGTNLSPQRCTMPFSLIIGSGDRTTIMPGWVLKSSPYTIIRSEKKFATRRKAIRHKDYTGYKIFRPSTIQLCINARNELKSIQQPTANSYYTTKLLPGIGSNILTEKARLTGIQAYTQCIQLFALQGLYDFLLLSRNELENFSIVDVLKNEFVIVKNNAITIPNSEKGSEVLVEWPTFPWDVDQSQTAFWQYQKQLILMEFPYDEGNKTVSAEWINDLLQTLLRLEQELATNIYKCKQRDDTRGKSTIPGYENSHIPADKDPVIIEIQNEFKEKENYILTLIQNMQGSWRSKL